MSNYAAIFATLSVFFTAGCEGSKLTSPSLVHKSSDALQDWNCDNKESATFSDFQRCPLNTRYWVEAMSGSYDQFANTGDVKAVAFKTMFAIDANYQEFEANLISNDRGIKFLPEAIEMILPIAGVTESVDAVEYAAVDILGNGYNIFQDKYLAGSTVDLIVEKMRVDRISTRTYIEERLDSSTNSNKVYLLSTALRDIQDYQLAGTIYSALSGIEEKQREDGGANRASSKPK